MAGKRESGKARRVARIVNEARNILKESGDQGLSMQVLADRSQVSLTTLYNLLGSRQAVLLQVLNEDTKVFGAAYEGEEFTNPLDAILALPSFARFVIEKEIIYWSAVYLSLSQAGSKEARSEVRKEYMAVWRKPFQAAMEQGFFRGTVQIDCLLILIESLFDSNWLRLAMNDISHEQFEARLQYGCAAILAGAVSRPHVQRVRAVLLAGQARQLELEQNGHHINGAHPTDQGGAQYGTE